MMAARFKEFLRKHLRKILVVFLFLVLAGWATGYFKVHLLPRKSFDSPQDLVKYVEFPNTLWRGTPYVGDENGSSHFLHRSGPQKVLQIPQDSWEPPKRFPLTSKRSQWIDWYECFPRKFEPLQGFDDD